jgi:hypothetical protein
MTTPHGRVAELGPGASLGVGLAALLSGAKRYSALDVVPHADLSRNVELLHDLVRLFERREPIPAAEEFPYSHPRLDSYAFPSHILDDDLLGQTLHPTRVKALEETIEAEDGARTREALVSYHVPWSDPSVIEPHSLDMLWSQVVMEHVDDVQGAYEAM